MASTAAPGARGRLPFLLLPLLLPLLLSPARGNEGGAAGSCHCRKVAKPPPFVDKLESCDTCGGFTRFNFPNRRVCGLPEDPWVSQLKNSHCGKGRPGEGAGRVDASRGHRPPTPTSSRVAPTPTPPSSARVSPDRSRGTLGAAEPGMGVASVPTMAGSGPGPSAEAAAREADKAPPEEREATLPPAPDATTPIKRLAKDFCQADTQRLLPKAINAPVSRRSDAGIGRSRSVNKLLVPGASEVTLLAQGRAALQHFPCCKGNTRRVPH